MAVPGEVVLVESGIVPFVEPGIVSDEPGVVDVALGAVPFVDSGIVDVSGVAVGWVTDASGDDVVPVPVVSVAGAGSVVTVVPVSVVVLVVEGLVVVVVAASPVAGSVVAGSAEVGAVMVSAVVVVIAGATAVWLLL